MGTRPTSDAPCTLFCPRSGCSPVPGRPTCPVINESAMRQRALSVPWTCWEIPIPQKTMARSAVAYLRATVRMVSASMPHTAAIFSGGKSSTRALSAANPSV